MLTITKYLPLLERTPSVETDQRLRLFHAKQRVLGHAEWSSVLLEPAPPRRRAHPLYAREDRRAGGRARVSRQQLPREEPCRRQHRERRVAEATWRKKSLHLIIKRMTANLKKRTLH